jgi:hypothetical protein
LRNLPTGYLDLRDKDLAAQPLLDLFRRCTLKKQLKRLSEIIPSGLNAIALAGDVQLRAKGNETIPFSLDDRR